MNHKNRINTLFTRLLDNSISEKELDELLGYLDHPTSGQEVRALMNQHWESVKDFIPAGETDLQSAKRFSDILDKTGIRKSSGKHEISGPSRSTRLIRILTVAAGILLLVSIAGYWWFNADQEDFAESQLATTQYTGKQAVTLPDGSVIILNEGSKLSFSAEFGIEDREIRFSGEGYFDIVPDSDRPFRVHTGDVTTTVLGTSFNLMAYEDQSEIRVAVERGEVAVGDIHSTYEKIRPEEQITVHKRTRRYEKQHADLEKILAWKEQFLILTETTIAEAAELIGDRYHVQVFIHNESMKNCSMNAAFMHGETLEQVLQVVCGVLQAEYEISNNKVEIFGGRKCE